MSIGRKSLDAASSKAALLLWIVSSAKSWAKSLTSPPVASFGSWTSSAHRGQKAVDRLRSKWPNAWLIHTRIHASWLNQIEIYFSIVQRKVLTPNDFSSLAELEQRLLAFQHHYERDRFTLSMDLHT